MTSLFSVAQIRSAETLALAQGEPLMRRAAYAAAQFIGQLGSGVVKDRRLRRKRIPTVRTEILLLVGPGNNGADALWTGYFLRLRGFVVRAGLVQQPLAGAAVAASRAFVGAGGTVEPVSALAQLNFAKYAVVVDGIYGIGGRAGLGSELSWLANELVHYPGWLVALDVPSGVAADTGEIGATGALAVDYTLSFGVAKFGLYTGIGAEYAGQIIEIDIGLRPYLARESTPARESTIVSGQEAVSGEFLATVADSVSGKRSQIGQAVAASKPEDTRYAVEPVAQLADAQWAKNLRLPQLSPQVHKYSRGAVLLWAGSTQYPGAGSLAAVAASQSGAGLIYWGTATAAVPGFSAATAAGTAELAHIVPLHDWDNAVSRSSAFAVGPGWPTQQWVSAGTEGDVSATDSAEARTDSVGSGAASSGLVLKLRDLLATGKPIVIDATAITLVPFLRENLHNNVLLTPHEGEFLGLWRQIMGTGLTAAQLEPGPNRVAALTQLAQQLQVTILLKGHRTLVYDPAAPNDQQLLVLPAAVPELATAGSGDVLTGLVAGLWAQLAAAATNRTSHGSKASQHRTPGLTAAGSRTSGPGIEAVGLPAQLPGEDIRPGVVAAWASRWHNQAAQTLLQCQSSFTAVELAAQVGRLNS